MGEAFAGLILLLVIAGLAVYRLGEKKEEKDTFEKRKN